MQHDSTDNQDLSFQERPALEQECLKEPVCAGVSDEIAACLTGAMPQAWRLSAPSVTSARPGSATAASAFKRKHQHS